MKALNDSFAPDVRNRLVDAIARTPLIRLRVPFEVSGSEILGKAEFLDLGASVKDRPALFMICDAQRGAHALAGELPVGERRPR